MALKSRFKTTLSFSTKSGGILGSISAFFADFLIPIADFGLELFAFFGVLLLLLLIAYALFDKPIRNLIGDSPDDNGIWFLPLAGSVLIMCLIALGVYLLGHSAENKDKGFFATQVPILAQLQEQTKQLESINQNTAEMVVEQKKANKSLDSIDNNTDEVAKNTESSSESLKELSEIANRQSFSSYDFANSIKHADIERVKFYLNSEKWRDSFYKEAELALNGSIAKTIIELNDDQQGLAMLKLLQNEGYIDSSERVKITGYEEMQFVDSVINTPRQEKHKKEKKAFEQKIAALTAEKEELDKSVQQTQSETLKQHEQCIEKHKQDKANLDKKLEAMLAEINTKKKKAHEKESAEITRKKTTYKEKSDHYIALMQSGSCGYKDKECQNERKELNQWLEDNKSDLFSYSHPFHEESIYTNETIQAVKKEELEKLGTPECLTTSPSFETPNHIASRLEEIETEKAKLEAQKYDLLATPTRVSGTRTEKSLLRIAEDNSNDIMLQHLKKQKQPTDGLHVAVYHKDEIIYSE